MKNPAPSFQFYPADFLADLNVQAMTMKERGIYITVLSHCWIEDGLPVGSRVVEGWFKQYPTIANCFMQIDGKYRNQRLDKERQKQIEWREKSAYGGHKSAERKRLKPRLKGGSRVVKPPFKLSSSSSNEDSRESSIKAENHGPLFDSLWSQWPSEGRFKKKICRAKFEVLVKREEYDAFRVATLGYSNYLLHKKENEGFEQSPMHLVTWLNNWKEEASRYVGKDGKAFKYEPRL